MYQCQDCNRFKKDIKPVRIYEPKFLFRTEVVMKALCKKFRKGLERK